MNIRNERGSLTAHPLGIEKIIEEEYYEQFYAHRYGNLEVEQSLKIYIMSICIQEGHGNEQVFIC